MSFIGINAALPKISGCALLCLDCKRRLGLFRAKLQFQILSEVNVARAACDLVIVLHDVRGGGAERAMLRLAKGFLDAGLSVALVLVQGTGEYMKDLPEGLELHLLEGSSVMASIGRIGRKVQELAPRAVLAALTHVNVAVCIARMLYFRHTPTFISERNQISEKRASARGLRERLTFALVPMLYRKADGVIAVSDGVADDVRVLSRLPEGKVHYVHNPVYDHTILDRAAQPSPHPWLGDGGDRVIIAVGRLHPQKDFSVLMEAFIKYRKNNPARLVIFGEGPERGKLEAMAADSGFAHDISLPGFCDNPFAAMARADLLVLSSRWEGFPNVLVEAMSCGCPVAATNCPSGPSEILDHGRYGPLVAVGDVAGLADAIASTIGSLEARQKVSARAAKFSIDNAVAGYRAIMAL